MSTREPRASQPPLLATATATVFPSPPVAYRTHDLLDTLNAAGVTATEAQVHALAGHSMTGLGCWTPSAVLRDLEPATSQHFSIPRHAQHAADQANVWATRKETTR